MANKLFVAGLAFSVSDSQLEEYFSQAGKVISAKVIIDRYSGQGKGFGFVEMTNEAEAQTAMNKLNGTQLADRTIVVKEARPQENRTYQSRNNDRGGW